MRQSYACLHAEVTGKLEDFLQGWPEEVLAGVEYVASQINDTLGFLGYMASTAAGIVGHLADDMANLETMSQGKLCANTFALAVCLHRQ